MLSTYLYLLVYVLSTRIITVMDTQVTFEHEEGNWYSNVYLLDCKYIYHLNMGV